MKGWCFGYSAKARAGNSMCIKRESTRAQRLSGKLRSARVLQISKESTKTRPRRKKRRATKQRGGVIRTANAIAKLPGSCGDRSRISRRVAHTTRCSLCGTWGQTGRTPSSNSQKSRRTSRLSPHFRLQRKPDNVGLRLTYWSLLLLTPAACERLGQSSNNSPEDCGVCPCAAVGYWECLQHPLVQVSNFQTAY